MLHVFELQYVTALFVVGATALCFYVAWPRKSSCVFPRPPLSKGFLDPTHVVETTKRHEQCGVDKDFNLVPRYAPQGIASKEGCPARTIPQMMQLAVDKRPDSVALRYERVNGAQPPLRMVDGAPVAPSLPWDQWTPLTWSEYHKMVRQCAKSFMKCGVNQFDSVNIFGFNSPEWFIADLGIVFAGGKAAGIYPTDTAEQVVYKSRHSGSKVAVVETAEKVEPFASKIDELPLLTTVVVWTAGFDSKEHGPIRTADGREVQVYSWDEFMALGSHPVSGISDKQLDERIGAIEPGMCTHLIYTSGRSLILSSAAHLRVCRYDWKSKGSYGFTRQRPFCDQLCSAAFFRDCEPTVLLER